MSTSETQWESPSGPVTEGGAAHLPPHSPLSLIPAAPNQLSPPNDVFTDLGTESEHCSLIYINYSVLDCTICSEALKPPVYQCTLGHVVCSTCYPRIPKKCHVCCQIGEFNRCFAMEKVLTSMKFSCRNKENGCKEILHYYDLKEHSRKCSYVLYYYPHPSCSLCLSGLAFVDHVRDIHQGKEIHICHGLPVDILIPKTCGSIVLIEEDCIFLIQKGGGSTSPDTTLSMLCTRVSTPKDEEFFFELNVLDPVDGRKGTFFCHSWLMRLPQKLTLWELTVVLQCLENFMRLMEILI